MDYKLFKTMRDKGFPQSPYMNQLCQHDDSMACSIKSFRNPECEWVSVPTLEEVIESCGNDIDVLENFIGYWACGYYDTSDGGGFEEQSRGSTPLEAVCNLWLALNAPQNS